MEYLLPSPGPGCQAKTGEATSIIAANNPKQRSAPEEDVYRFARGSVVADRDPALFHHQITYQALGATGEELRAEMRLLAARASMAVYGSIRHW